MTIRSRPTEDVGCAGNRRFTKRLGVDTRANLLLVKAGIVMPGHILDLSLGGCRLHTESPFNVGIYVRVETEFFLRGLPFRLAGVSQVVVDKNTIGIRFLDLSERKREQLLELIAEIEEDRVPSPAVHEEHWPQP